MVGRQRAGRQDLYPRIHLTESDFASITRQGAHCSTRGTLGPRQFEAAMREQVSVAQ